MKSKRGRKLITLASSLCLWALIIASQKNSLDTDETENVSHINNQIKREKVRLAKNSPTIGFRNIISNWAFVQFLEYFGDDESRKITGYDNSSDYLSTAIHHDPYFKDLYVFLSGSSTLYAGQPEKTVRLMAEGLSKMNDQRAPDSYYIWRYKGTDELLFLGDNTLAQQSFEMAARWAFESEDSMAEIVGKVSSQTSEFLKQNGNSELAQINAWTSILSNALNDETRNRAVLEIRRLGGEVVQAEDGRFRIEYPKISQSPKN